MPDRANQVYVRALRTNATFACCQVGGDNLSDRGIVQI